MLAIWSRTARKPWDGITWEIGGWPIHNGCPLNPRATIRSDAEPWKSTIQAVRPAKTQRCFGTGRVPIGYARDCRALEKSITYPRCAFASASLGNVAGLFMRRRQDGRARRGLGNQCPQSGFPNARSAIKIAHAKRAPPMASRPRLPFPLLCRDALGREGFHRAPPSLSFPTPQMGWER